MNLIKKITAAVLVMIMVLCVAGCHEKDEVAVTIDGVEFTSAYYMCALIMADSEARQKVDEKLAEEKEDDKTSTATEEVNYFKQKIDKKKFTDWVEDRAIESLKSIASYIIKCREEKVEIDEEDKSSAEQYAAYYWSSYGYAALLEPNGVSAATYTKYMTDSYYASAYFEHLYGEGGSKEIPADEVNTKLLENYVIANVIDVSTASMKDTEKAETKTKLDGYLADLTSGAKDFEKVYHEYYGTSEEEAHSHENEDKTEGEEKEEGSEPLDSHATILGSEDTSYASDIFKDVKAMANGEIKLIEKEDDAGYALVIKKDISADPYYAKNLDISVRDLIKGDEFEKDMEKFAEGLTADINKYAVGQFKVKKIEYPEAAY